MLKVTLCALPNPDYPRGDHRGSVRIKKHQVEVADFKAASVAVRKFIDDNELGGGNFPHAKITGAGFSAFVSYNGRVWKKGSGDWTTNEEVKID